MTRSQERAYGDPCLIAEDTAKSKFGQMTRYYGRQISVVLTVNVGLE